MCPIGEKKGDLVKVGQKIGESEAFMSCPVHSSVSGEVVDVSEMLLANGKTCKSSRNSVRRTAVYVGGA